MSLTTPSTAAARHLSLGTDDQSIATIPVEKKLAIQHVPLIMMNTLKGNYERTHISGNEFAALYGIESLVPTSKHWSFLNAVPKILLSKTTAVINRIPGKRWDAVTSAYVPAKSANAFLCVLTNSQQVAAPVIIEKTYVRDTTGTVALDANNDPTFTINDVEVNHVGFAIFYPPANYVSNGELPASTTVTVNGNTYELIPFKELTAEGHGAYYNNLGFTFAPNIGSDLDTTSFDKFNTLTYDFSMFNKETGKNKVINTVLGDTSLTVCMNQEAVTDFTNQSLFFDTLVPTVYGNNTDPLLPLQSSLLNPDRNNSFLGGNDAKFEEILTKVLAKEIKQTGTDGTGTVSASTWADYGVLTDGTDATINELAEAKFNIVNFVNGLNSKEYRYETIRPIPSADLSGLSDLGVNVVGGNTSTVYSLRGGEDSDKKYLKDVVEQEKAFVEQVERYADKNDKVISIALNRDTVVYDPGLTLLNKVKLGAYISIKRNTLLGLSTAIYGEAKQDISVHLSRQAAIKSIVTLNVESVVYNTPTARCFVVMGSGLLSDGTLTKRVPLLYDYATKLAKYAGALNGEWKGSEDFYGQGGSIVTTMKDINPGFIPDSIKDKLYDVGLIWPDNEDTLTFFYPQHQTIYPNASSVLNSVLTAVAIGTLNTINDGIWRKYAGVVKYSNLDIKLAVEEDVREATAGIFDGAFVIKPEVYYTKRDEALGWLYRLRVSLYSNISKNSQITSIIVRNLKDLD